MAERFVRREYKGDRMFVSLDETERGEFELAWNDYGPNGWVEMFPTVAVAFDRMCKLIELDGLDPDEPAVFDLEYDDFLWNRLGPHAAEAWRWRDYMSTMRDRGYEAATFNSGGGIILIETWLKVNGSSRWLVWTDDNEGYPRWGIYYVDRHDDVADTCFMRDYPTGFSQALMANEVADLLDVIRLGIENRRPAVPWEPSRWTAEREAEIAQLERMGHPL